MTYLSEATYSVSHLIVLLTSSLLYAHDLTFEERL
jgi:hypothetical protein